MSSSNREMQLQKTCELYAYVLTSLGKEVPDEVQECAYGLEYPIDCVKELSEILKSLDTDTFDKLVNNKDSTESRNLSYWWEMQQEADRLHKELSADM